MKNDKTLTIRLPGGDIIKTSNRAKRMKITFSEAIRRAIRAWLGFYAGKCGCFIPGDGVNTRLCRLGFWDEQDNSKKPILDIQLEVIRPRECKRI